MRRTLNISRQHLDALQWSHQERNDLLNCATDHILCWTRRADKPETRSFKYAAFSKHSWKRPTSPRWRKRRTASRWIDAEPKKRKSFCLIFSMCYEQEKQWDGKKSVNTKSTQRREIKRKRDTRYSLCWDILAPDPPHGPSHLSLAGPMQLWRRTAENTIPAQRFPTTLNY